MSRTEDGARTDYWYDLTGLAQETVPGDATVYLRSASDGRPLSISDQPRTSEPRGNIVRNYALDRLGSATALVDQSDALSATYRYDPYGLPNGGTGTAYNPLQYAGGYRDATTGFDLMGVRYHQPFAGRFTQLDALPRMLLTINRYEYAGSNPCNFTDPTGLDHCLESGVLVLGGMLTITGLILFPPAGAALPTYYYWYHMGETCQDYVWYPFR